MRLHEKTLLIMTMIIPAVVSLVLGGVGYFVFYKKASFLSKKMIEVDQQTKAAKDKAEKMVETSGRIEKLIEEKAGLEALLPTKEEISYENFIDTLTGLSREAGVRLPSVKYESPRSAPPGRTQSTLFDKITYKVTIEGEFFNALYFVYLLETYQRFIKVERFTVRPMGAVTAGDAKATKYALDLSLTSYVYNKPQDKK